MHVNPYFLYPFNNLIMKKISLFFVLALLLSACDTSTLLTQQDVIDKVCESVKSEMDDASKFAMVGCSIDTAATNSPLIDPDAYPALFGAALHMNLVRMTSDLAQKTNTQKDHAEFAAELDSVRHYMRPVMARVAELNKQEKVSAAGYFVCLEYKDGNDKKEGVYYYNLSKGEVEKKSWEPDVFGQMLSLLDEFTENPSLLEDN